ncbi:hypothetical protein ACSSS7_005884 [Eimeria intestinalis]
MTLQHCALSMLPRMCLLLSPRRYASRLRLLIPFAAARKCSLLGASPVTTKQATHQRQQEQRQQQQQQQQQQHEEQRRGSYDPVLGPCVQSEKRPQGGRAALAAAGVACWSVGGSNKREVKLGDVADFPEGGMYEVSVNEGKDKVLVSHLNGSFYCTASTCPHYGAPLAKGVAVTDHVTCPWHDAKFDLKTGKCLAGPVTQPIRTFPVSVKNSAVFADLPETFADEPLPKCCFERPETVSMQQQQQQQQQHYQQRQRQQQQERSQQQQRLQPSRTRPSLSLGEARQPRLLRRSCAPKASRSSECAAAAAAFAAAAGRLIIISKEQLPPYDRIMLSKNLKCEAANSKMLLDPAPQVYLLGAASGCCCLVVIAVVVLRPPEFFSDTLNAELRLGCCFRLDILMLQWFEEGVGVELSPSRQHASVSFEAARKCLLVLVVCACVSVPQVLVCTGCTYRRLSGVKGSDAEGVLYVREMEDLQKFRDSLFSDVNTPQGLRFVVVGSSFIGVEVAAALTKTGVKEVCVVGQEKVPFERALGHRIGGAFKKLLEANNITFIPQVEVQEIITRDNKVMGVRLNSGRVLAADRVVVGIGAMPLVPQIKSSKPIKQGVRGGLSVDPFLKTASYPNIFAAGDIASFPYIQSGDETRIEHYATAMDLGRSAAANMLDLQQPFTGLPFFWTMVFGKGLRYVGDGHGHDDVIIEGDLEKMQFVAYYTKGDKVRRFEGRA